MTARPAASRPDPTRGFVLVGVVMMVMALTIIGISLYSLSGYESQFFGQTLSSRQALYTANGSLELAKKLLETPLGSPPAARLSNVARAIGREGVVSAVAWQDNPPDSSGPVNWGDSVHVRVGVRVQGATRTVHATYTLAQLESPYWRLFASATPIRFVGGSPRHTIRARGGAWHPVQAAADSAWLRDLETSSVVALEAKALQAPAAASFIAAHYPTGPADTASVTRDYDPVAIPAFPHYRTLFVTMDAGPAADASRYFRSASDSLTVFQANLPLFDFYSGANVLVRVRGTAVWIIPRGAYFEGEFRVEPLPGATTANLVLVTGPNGRYGPFLAAGPWFGKGISTSNNGVNVFVVSDGVARIEDYSITPQEIETRNLSVYANAIELRGPAAGTHRLELGYDPAMRQVADELYGRGLLPAAPGVQSGTFTFRRGSWRQSPGLQ